MNLTQRLSRSRAGRQSWSFPKVLHPQPILIPRLGSFLITKSKGSSVEKKPNQPKPSALGFGLKHPFQTIQFNWNHKEHNNPAEKITSEGWTAHLWGGGGGGGHGVSKGTTEQFYPGFEQSRSGAGLKKTTKQNQSELGFQMFLIAGCKSYTHNFSVVLLAGWAPPTLLPFIHEEFLVLTLEWVLPSSMWNSCSPLPGERVPVHQHRMPGFPRLEKTFEIIRCSCSGIPAAFPGSPASLQPCCAPCRAQAGSKPGDDGAAEPAEGSVNSRIWLLGDFSEFQTKGERKQGNVCNASSMLNKNWNTIICHKTRKKNTFPKSNAS